MKMTIGPLNQHTHQPFSSFFRISHSKFNCNMTQYTYMSAITFLKVKKLILVDFVKNSTCPILELPENTINQSINKNLFL